MELASDEIPSPMGTIVTAVSEQGLCTLDFDDCAERMHGLLRSRFGTGVRLVRRTDPAGTSTVIRAYLGGDLTALDSITVDVGGTPFQERVWNQLRRIRCGETISYSELAAKIGQRAPLPFPPVHLDEAIIEGWRLAGQRLRRLAASR